jgi:SAM-dependent methyltransferase
LLLLTTGFKLGAMSLRNEDAMSLDSITAAPPREIWIHKSFGYYQDVAVLCRFFINEGQSVLEVGTSTGWLLRQFRQATRRVGVDKCQNAIQEARSISSSQLADSNIEFRVQNFEDEDCDLGQKFDLIVFSDLISYSYDTQQLFENARRHLNPGGRLLVTTYNSYLRPIYSIGEFLGLKRQASPDNWLTKGDIQNISDLSGFEKIREGHRGLLPWRWFGLGEWINRWIAPLPFFRFINLYYYTLLRPRTDTAEGAPRRKISKVSVIVPARNEAGNIAAAVERLPKLADHVELIFVEGNSSDKTWSEIQRVCQSEFPKPSWLNVQSFQQQGKGKADAVHLGFSQATGDILMILDADLTVMPEALPRFVEPLKNGSADFAHGCRLVYPMEGKAMPYLNMLANLFFSRSFTFLLGQRFKDTLCGTKVLWREDWDKIVQLRSYFGTFDPFGDFELLYGAVKLNHKIAEIPVHYKARTYGSTNLSRWRDGWILLKMLKFAASKLKFF